MNAIRSVFTAFAHLAASVNGLASIIDAATGRLQQQLALDEAPPALPPSGTILDAEANGNPSTKGRRGRAGTV